MAPLKHTVVRTALLFTRGQESVYMEVQEGRFGPQLLIRGPGSASRVCDFQDIEGLVTFQGHYEKELLDRGFQLNASTERRTGSDRHPRVRPEPERRRH